MGPREGWSGRAEMRGCSEVVFMRRPLAVLGIAAAFELDR